MRRIILDESQGTLPGLRRAVQEICEVLPTLEITGSRDIAVDRTQMGTVIRTTKGSNMIPQQTQEEDPHKHYSNYSYITTQNGVKGIHINAGFMYIAGAHLWFDSQFLAFPNVKGTYYVVRRIIYNPETYEFSWYSGYNPVGTKPRTTEDYYYEYGLCYVYIDIDERGSIWYSNFTVQHTGGDIYVMDRLGQY